MNRRILAASLALLLSVSVPVWAADPKVYVDKIAYEAPAAPSDPEVLRMDLAMVRAVQAAPGSLAWQEADGDARAYEASDIARKFEDAVRAPLTGDGHKILIDVLNRAQTEDSKFVSAAKKANPRNRPYVGNDDIHPCNLEHIKENESYPSGHSARGYLTGLILAEVYPEKANQILARGARYGDNRVVCGVHHPIDVQQGRMVAISYFSALKQSEAFKSDFACVANEAKVAAKVEPKLTKKCEALLKEIEKATKESKH
jgi:acid phosphatase (class A)